ncbi:MAG: hypothetical protein IJ661_11910 [Lachnospiraceae bacterium]|nr:hypothetical protein [Lachnospiraceae bacterium]
MSTGISISSINRIKELAEEKKYAEALEILDTQNLDKSINPQFLRISGEIFRENKRYYDSRRILIKSHEMAPQGTRIIAELIELYLELGYFTRAKKYYEQYTFYSTEEDTQKDYVEYIMKKAAGGDIKELASILIPILETMPEDKWNFEAVLLYHKLDRKDKALEEAQYILENYKESIYIKPVIEYIDDKLDVDKYFYIYPKEEVAEDKELYGKLIEHEDKVLEADHYRMYPPEAKIIVEAEDKDAVDVKPSKEKKPKKKREKRNKNSDNDTMQESQSEGVNDASADTNTADDKTDDDTDDKKAIDADSENQEAAKELVKKEREEALDRILAKKVDAEAIRESSKAIARNVTEDAKKAKEQVKKVTDVVIDNVVKAADTLGDAVGAAKPAATYDEPTDEFVDGIIESVLEPPKKAVGQVVTNEELDALVPDSLEAMSPDEVKELETRKEEQEKLELEALEAAVLIEDKKKNKKKLFSFDKKEDTDLADAAGDTDDQAEEVIVIDSNIKNEAIASVSFEELKNRFLADQEDEEEAEDEPLETLGFMSVVQSDVDDKMEDEAPEAADILHRMIDNKEYYTGEDSRGFESKASYENHGFEVDDYEFNDYIGNVSINDNNTAADYDSINDQVYKVEEIYTDNSIIDFEEIIPDTDKDEAKQYTESIEEPKSEPVKESYAEPVEEMAEEHYAEPIEEAAEEHNAEPVEEIAEEHYAEPIEEAAEEHYTESAEDEEADGKYSAEFEPYANSDEADTFIAPRWENDEDSYDEPIWKSFDESESYQTIDVENELKTEPDEESTDQLEEDVQETEIQIEEEASEEPIIQAAAEEELSEEPIIQVEGLDEDPLFDHRHDLRVRIILTDKMIQGLLDLKESR